MKILGTIGLLIAAAVIWYVVSYPSATIRYRLSLDIETPEGPKTGSGVIEIKYRLTPCPICNGGGPKLKSFVNGQAVDVDLGQRGRVYALLVGRDSTGAPNAGSDAAGLFLRVLGPVGEGGTASSARAIGSVSGKAEVPAKLLPMLVRFRDEKDPKTVEAVDPANLPASFGDGVKLNRVWIETVSSGAFPFNMFGITGTPLTTGIEKRLGWLQSYYEKRLDGDRYGSLEAASQIANSLSSGAFKSNRN